MRDDARLSAGAFSLGESLAFQRTHPLVGSMKTFDRIHDFCLSLLPEDRVRRHKNVLLLRGDCTKIMSRLAEPFSNTCHLWLNDPPYGTTLCAWDSVIPMPDYWKMTRVMRKDAAMVVFGSQPFTSTVVVSNIKQHRHTEVWNKGKCGSPGLAKYRPMKVHEDVMVFSRKTHRYFPQMEEGAPYTCKPRLGKARVNNHKMFLGNRYKGLVNEGTRYPKSILNFSRDFSAQQQIHPTQKPVPLLEWLIRSYSQEGEIVVDVTAGSGSTGIAAHRTGRCAILIERDPYYWKVANTWLKYETRGVDWNPAKFRKENPPPAQEN